MSSTGGVSRTGSAFRGYEILEELGAGGMGVVYRARDSKLGRNVALKFLPSTSAAGSHERQRFLLEAQSCSALDHPCVGVIHGIEEGDDGELCIVMACYEGQTLANRIDGSPLPPDEAIRIAAQVADGLAEAHLHGIVHRDVKPSNIFLPRKGGVKILDFGLAKLLRDDAGLTQTEMRVGTPAYMSPEQVRGLEVNERTDIWALGAVLYEMLTGQRPFRGGDSYSLLFAVVHSEPDRTSLSSPELRSIVFKALNKEPGDRYSSMQEFADALRRTSAALEGRGQSETALYSTEAANVPPPVLPAGVRLNGWRRPWAIAALGAIVIAISVWYYFPLRTPPKPTTLAILPFSSSADPASAALAGGFAEALTRRVTQFELFRESLTVVPVYELTSRKIKDAADARKRLAATMVISGVLARDGNGRIRLTFQAEGRDYPRPVSSVVEDSRGDVSNLEEKASAAIGRWLDIRASTPQAGGSGSKAYEPYLRGLGYLQRWDAPENRAAALAALGDAEKTDPSFPAVEVALSEAYRLRFAAAKDPEDVQRALKHAQKAVELDGTLAESHVALGRVYVETAQRDLAVLEFQRVLEKNPKNWAANSGTARTYEDMGRKEEAEKAYLKTVALRPYTFGPYNELANFYVRQGRYADSEAQFRKALEVTPDNAAMYSNLAVVLRRQNKFPEAIGALQKSLALNPSYAAFSNLGNIYYLQSQFHEAAAAYDSALRLNDKDFRLWGSRGQALNKSGADIALVRAAYRRALEGAEQALRVKPDGARTLSLMALYQARLGEKENAKKLITQALVNPGGDYTVLTDAALVYEVLGRRDEAMRWIRKALDQGYSWEEFRTDPDFATLAKE